MRALTLFLVSALVFWIIAAKRTYVPLPEHGTFHFKLFKCQPTAEGIRVVAYPNYTCYAKSWSRTVSTINGYMLLRRNFSEAYITGELFYKYGTIYRQVMRLPQFDICRLMEFAAKNILLRQIYVAAKAAAPDFVHFCPYDVLEAYNVSFPSHAMFSLFSQGDYKAVMNFTLKPSGPLVSTITAIGTAYSSVKESFG